MAADAGHDRRLAAVYSGIVRTASRALCNSHVGHIRRALFEVRRRTSKIHLILPLIVGVATYNAAVKIRACHRAAACTDCTAVNVHLYVLNAVRCPYVHTYVRTSVTLGVASSVANGVTMRMTS